MYQIKFITLILWLMHLSCLASSKIALWRYKDPVLGPRLIPNYLQPTENSIMMTSETIFSLDLEKKIIEYQESQSTLQPLGSKIMYVIQ